LRRKCEAAQRRRRRAEERAEAERARRDLEQLEETELERSRRAAETQRRLTEAIQQEEEARRQQVEHDTAVNNAFNVLTLHVASIGERLCNDMVSVCLSVCLSRRSAAATWSWFAAARAPAASISSYRSRILATDRYLPTAPDLTSRLRAEGSFFLFLFMYEHVSPACKKLSGGVLASLSV